MDLYHKNMKPLSFYIIFHDHLFQENTQEFSPQEISAFFTWVAVNEKVTKIFPAWLPEGGVLKEYEMKKYSPHLQMLNYYQNSAFFHLFWNPQLINSKYIGFGQYDMKISAKEFREIYSQLESDTADKVITAFPYSSISLYASALTKESWIHCFIQPYNEFFGMNHTLESLEKTPLCLLHTFIIPTWFFFHIMPFVENLMPKILKALQWDTRHLAGTLERIFALCISCGMVEGKFRAVLQLHGVQHVDQQHSEDTLRNIKQGSSKPTV